jgi:hypothetical protein
MRRRRFCRGRVMIILHDGYQSSAGSSLVRWGPWICAGLSDPLESSKGSRTPARARPCRTSAKDSPADGRQARGLAPCRLYTSPGRTGEPSWAFQGPWPKPTAWAQGPDEVSNFASTRDPRATRHRDRSPRTLGGRSIRSLSTFPRLALDAGAMRSGAAAHSIAPELSHIAGHTLVRRGCPVENLPRHRDQGIGYRLESSDPRRPRSPGTRYTDPPYLKTTSGSLCYTRDRPSL